MSTREDQAVRYWLTEKGETAAAQLDLPRCQAIVGCTTPATGEALSYARLGYVPGLPEARRWPRMTTESYEWPSPEVVPVDPTCSTACATAVCTPCALNIGSCCRGWVTCPTTGKRHRCHREDLDG